MFVRILKILKRTDAFAHVVLALSSLMSYFMLFDFKKNNFLHTNTLHSRTSTMYLCMFCMQIFTFSCYFYVHLSMQDML